MSKRMKEEERIERIIRNLLKQPENRRCINCSSLGPQYVCTTFWTFVCTTCSGIHREFTHRIKSVSMAKFNAEEINALQAGGNERVRQIYFKEWDPHCHSLPDGSNQSRLRDFIKHVYVDRKFTGERSGGKLAMVKVDVKEELSERYSIERLSPRGSFEDISSRYNIEERSPQYRAENIRPSRPRNRPSNFEIVDDRIRDDRPRGGGRRSESQRLSNVETRAGNRSPNSRSSMEKCSSPVVHPIKDILGENSVPLQVGESPRANNRPDVDFSSHSQRKTLCSNPGSVDGNQLVQKEVSLPSLIDFTEDIEYPDPVTGPQSLETTGSISGTNTACGILSKKMTSDAPNVNSMESILFELSAPAAVPVATLPAVQGSGDAPSTLLDTAASMAMLTVSNTKPAISCAEDVYATSHSGMALTLHSDSMGQKLPSMQQNQSYASRSSYRSAAMQQLNSVGVPNNQPLPLSLVPQAQGSLKASVMATLWAAPNLTQESSSGIGSQALPAEEKTTARMELPADLFTSSYPSFPAAVASWQTPPPQGMGFNMQYYPSAVPVSAFPGSAKSRNPFDLNDDSAQLQTTMFPSMSTLQGALPTSPSSAVSCQLMQPSAGASPVPPELPNYGMGNYSGIHMGQQFPTSVPLPRPQGINSLSGGEAGFGSLNGSQHPESSYSAPSHASSFSSVSGNPFG